MRALRKAPRRQLVLQWISHRVLMGASHVGTLFPGEDVTWAIIARIAMHKFTSLTWRNISASETGNRRKRSRIGRLKRLTTLQFSPILSRLTAPEFALSLVGRRSVPCQDNSLCIALFKLVTPQVLQYQYITGHGTAWQAAPKIGCLLRLPDASKRWWFFSIDYRWVADW